MTRTRSRNAGLFLLMAGLAAGRLTGAADRKTGGRTEQRRLTFTMK